VPNLDDPNGEPVPTAAPGVAPNWSAAPKLSESASPPPAAGAGNPPDLGDRGATLVTALEADTPKVAAPDAGVSKALITSSYFSFSGSAAFACPSFAACRALRPCLVTMALSAPASSNARTIDPFPLLAAKISAVIPCHSLH